MNLKVRFGDYTNEIQAPAQQSDMELIRQIAARQHSALEELYRRYHLPVYNYLLRTTRNAATAEDLLQEIFIGVWEGAERFQARASVKTWIFRIGNYKLISWLRKRENQVDNFSSEVLEEVAIQDDISLENRAFQQWHISHIQKAMTQLSLNHREVIEFTFTHGLSQNEIAHILDCPIGTVKSRLHKALHQLHSILTAKGIITSSRSQD